MKKKETSPKVKKNKLRNQRYFSDTFKRQKVKELNSALISVTELSKLYEVSPQSIYRWLHKYSPNHEKGVVQVVQMESESQKTKQLLSRLSDLERIIGQKQLQIDYLEKLVEISSEELKVDLKKNFDTRSSATSIVSSKKKDSK
jgi:transposase-like protein